MARQREDLAYRPDLRHKKLYEKIYPLYRSVCECEGPTASVMRKLREIAI
jgi:hypothetical protein